MRGVEECVGLALACGGGDVGGPLTREELTFVRSAARVSAGDVRRTRRAIRDGEDPLGIAYLDVRSALERRAMGAYYTGSAIVEPMIAWALEHVPQRLIDPGCGSGRFTQAALRRRPDLEIVAVDVDPVATLLTRATLAVMGARRARVIQGDYLSIVVPRISGQTAFVGNPPYVRHHDLSVETKARAGSLAASIGSRISGLAGLHAMFYLATLAKHAAPGDIGAFVTASEWIDVGYGRIVREIFTSGLGGRSLLVFDARSSPFSDAMTTAAITTFRVGEQPAAVRIGHVTTSGTPFTLEREGRDCARTTLERARRWSPLLRDVDEAFEGDTIGTLFRVSRGQVTGANDFFVMSRPQARARGIEDFCVPLVSRAVEVFAADGVVRDGPDRKLGLVIPRDLDLSRVPHLAAYVRGGEAAKVHAGYVVSHRRPWYAVAFPKPPIVVTYMARQPPAFARNPDGLGLLNVAHGLYPRALLDDGALDRIVGRLNAMRSSFAGRGRTYHGGLEKFEPSEVERLPLTVSRSV